jgi:HK97 family phage major capsid protein
MNQQKDLLDEIKKSFETFKAENDAAMQKHDGLQNQKVEKINQHITNLEEKLEAVTKAINDNIENQAISDISQKESASAELAMFKLQAQSFDAHRDYVSNYDVNSYVNYKESFLNDYLRQNRSIKNTFYTGSNPDGGYLIPADMSGRIITKVYDQSPLRQLCFNISISSPTYSGSYDRDIIDGEWVGEQQVPSDQVTPTLGEHTISVHERASRVKVTKRMLEDSAIDIESWLIDKIATGQNRAENLAFLTGNGTNKPRGIMTYGTNSNDDDSRAWQTFQHIESGSATTIGTGDSLINLLYSLNDAFYPNAVFMMNKKTHQEIRKLKDGQGNYLWQPDFTTSATGLLLGHRIAINYNMPNIAAGTIPILFGDFRETYTIVDRLGMSMLRDPYTSSPLIKLTTYKRLGGDVVNFDSLKFFKIAQS